MSLGFLSANNREDMSLNLCYVTFALFSENITKCTNLNVHIM